MRMPVHALLLAASVLVLAGCDKKPTGQVVAVVNDEEITQQELNGELATLNLPKDRIPENARDTLLERLVDRNLLADYARENDLDKSPEFVAMRRRMEQTLLSELAMRKLVGQPKQPTPAEVQKFIAQNPLMFAQRQRLLVDSVRFAAPKDAAVVKAYAALPTLEAVIERLTADHVAFERGRAPLDTGAMDAKIAQQVVAHANGQIFDMARDGNVLIGAIVAREPVPIPQQRWPQAAAAAIGRNQLGKGAESAIAKLRKDARISYSPKVPPTQ